MQKNLRKRENIPETTNVDSNTFGDFLHKGVQNYKTAPAYA